MIQPTLLMDVLIWIGIALCTAQAAAFSGLNLAIFSVSKLRLEAEAANGHADAARVLELRKDSNLTLCTVIWGNVTIIVLLTLLSDSVLAGVGAFFFSTFVITFFGEIVPQAYFSRNAIRMAARFLPLLKLYQVVLYPLVKPTAAFLNWWLGPEGIAMLRERDFRALIIRHGGMAEADVGKLEATGAVNFLDLDDLAVFQEGEPLDPRSIITLPTVDDRPIVPKFERSPSDPFLQRLNASGKKWVVFAPESGPPHLVLDAHHFLRDVLFITGPVSLGAYCHRPIVVTDMRLRLGDVIGRMKVRPENPEDDVIDHDLILVWGEQKIIITGADLLGRLLRGISIREPAEFIRTVPPGGTARL